MKRIIKFVQNSSLKLYLLSVLLFFSFGRIVYSQDPAFNSSNSESQIVFYKEIANKLIEQNLLDSAVTVLKEALSIAEKKHLSKEIAFIDYEIADVLAKLSKYDEALPFYKYSAFISAQSADTVALAKAYNRIGVCYKHLGIYSEALQALNTSYLYYLALNDTVGLGSTKLNLGNVFKNIGHTDRAKDAYHEALNIYILAGELNGIGNCYNNLGNVFKNEGNLDSAQYYMNQTILIRKITGDQKGLSYIFHNLANLAIKMDKLDDAIAYTDSALIIKSERNDTYGIAGEMEVYSRIYFEKKDWKKAIQFAEKALSLAKNIGNAEFNRDAHKTIAFAAMYAGDHKKSSLNFLKFVETNESLKDLNSSEAIALELINYEIVSDSIQKEQLKLKKELQELNNENQALENQVLKRNYYLIITLLLLFLTLVILLLLAFRKRLIQTRIEREKLAASSVPKEEKEILLKEVHHRVKNNFQIINSLIRIQSEFMDGSNFKQKLKEIENRIRSMSLIHEKLYKSESISKLDVEEYISELTNHIVKSQESSVNVELKLNIDKTEYGIDSLIPLGLIINECISNSLQHGFNKNEGNEISIELRQNSEQTTIKIHDNGVGTSKSINELKTESLGMELICDLTEQLDGVLSLNTKEGFKYDFKFPSLK